MFPAAFARAISAKLKVLHQAATSIGWSMDFVAIACDPSVSHETTDVLVGGIWSLLGSNDHSSWTLGSLMSSFGAPRPFFMRELALAKASRPVAMRHEIGGGQMQPGQQEGAAMANDVLTLLNNGERRESQPS